MSWGVAGLPRRLADDDVVVGIEDGLAGGDDTEDMCYGSRSVMRFLSGVSEQGYLSSCRSWIVSAGCHGASVLSVTDRGSRGG